MNKKSLVILIVFCLLCAFPLYSEEGEMYTLDSLILAMERGNADLLKADQEALKAQLDTADAKGGYTPKIDLLISGTYMANPTMGPIKISPNDIKGLPAIASSVWTDPIDVSFDMGNNLVQGQLTLTQPIYTWGKLSNAVKLYETVEGIRGMERSDKENQLIAELKSRLDALYYMDRIRPLLTEIDAKADKLISIAESAEENGMLLPEDVLSAKIQKQQVEISRKEIDNQYASVLEALRTLTGISDLTMDMIEYSPDEGVAERVLAIGKESLIALATDPSRLTLQMLGGMEKVMGYTNEIAKGSIYGKPDIALQVSATYGGKIDSNWLDSDTWGLNITLALSTTLWDGGKKMNDIKRSASDITSASIDKESAIRTIEENVSSSYDSAELSMEKIEFAALKCDSDKLKAENKQNALSVGSASESDVLQAEIQVVQDEIELITERISLSQSVYTLMYLTSLDAEHLPVITDGMAGE